MCWIKKSMALLLCVFLSLPSVSASSGDERHVVNPLHLYKLMQERVDRDRANRELIQRVLQRAEVREVAQRFGLNLHRAETAVPTLPSSDLEELAQRAGDVEEALAGGDTLVITASTLVIILLLIILIMVVAD